MFSKWLGMAFASITFQGSEGLQGGSLPAEIPHLGKKATTWLPTEEPAAGSAWAFLQLLPQDQAPGGVGWGGQLVPSVLAALSKVETPA